MFTVMKSVHLYTWEQVWTDWDNLYRCPYCDGFTEIQPLN